MKKLAIIFSLAVIVSACGTGAGSDVEPTGSSNVTSTTDKPAYDTMRGEGKFKNVQVTEKLEPALASAGEKVYSVKCSSCHKTSDEKLVGPGWKGVTQRNKPEWIMNFVTNPDPMIDKDPKVQAQLEICLVRMPNQNVTDEDARALYEFMRKNDGVK